MPLDAGASAAGRRRAVRPRPDRGAAGRASQRRRRGRHAAARPSPWRSTHHLVSAYTSLVAVDVTPTAPAGVASLKTSVPGNLPEGLSYDAFYGGLPQTATPAALELVIGALLMTITLFGYALARPGTQKRLLRDPLERLDGLTRAARRIC